jgi:hypothetical protein
LTGHTWWLQWSAPIFLVLVLAVGAVLHLRTRVSQGSVELAPVPTSAGEK